jgi:hypothetical protein
MILSPIILYTYAGRHSRRVHDAFARAGVHQTLAERVALKRNVDLTRMMLLFNYFQVSHRLSQFLVGGSPPSKQSIGV